MTTASVIRIASTALLTGLVTAMVAASPVDGIQVAPGGGGIQPSAGGDVIQPPAHTGFTGWKKTPSAELKLPVHSKTGAPLWTGRLVVKFRDNLQARADRGPGRLVGSNDASVARKVDSALTRIGGTIRQAINRTPDELRALEIRAFEKSGRTQPDLASMMYVDMPPGNLLDAARAFNDMPEVEWIDIEQEMFPMGGNQNQSPQFGCGQNGAGDDTGQNNCYTTGIAGRCSQIGGGNGCNNVGACNQDPVGVPCQYGCNNTTCCELVSDILPGCTDEAQAQGWDALCATYANILCQGNVYSGAAPVAGGQTAPNASYRFDPCFALRGPVDIADTQIPIQGTVVDLTTAGAGGLGIAPNVASQLMNYTLLDDGTVDTASLAFVAYAAPSDEGTAAVAIQAQPDPSLEGAYVALSAGCFGEHGFGGCSQTACCVYVCRNDPSCCTIEWDSTCVSAAQTAAELPANSPCTPATLPSGVFDPAVTPSPLVTSGADSGGDARGYQAYTVGSPVVGPADLLPPGVGPSAFAIAAPDVRVNDDNITARNTTNTNLGTLQFLLGGYRGGGFDLDGFEELSESIGIAGNLVRGNGINVAVIEHAAYVNHEDLVNRTIPEPYQTQVLINQGNIDPNHGTAVLGIIGAEANDFGVTGIASKCQLRFYPIVSREEGSRLLNALTSAIIQMGEGDIMNMSIGGGVVDELQQTVPSQPGPFNLILVGTSLGITSIISAGNDAVPVQTVPDDAPENVLDSGAIIVGACWPGFQNGLLTQAASNPGPYPGFAYCRLNFSSFTDLEADRGGEVHMSGWGTAVTTTGYGDLFAGDNGSADPLQVNKLRTYTAQFNGTSSAAPVVSGLAARVQSFSRQYFGVTLPPEGLRTVLANGGHQQCSIDYASPAFPGYPENGDASAGDLIPISQGGQLARIGPFPDAREALANTVSSSFGGNPVTGTVITGSLLQGNQFSLRVVDGIYLGVNAVKKRAGSLGVGYGVPLPYPMTGGTTDVQAQLLSVQSPSDVNTLSVATVGNVSANIPVIQLVYLWNKTQNRWISLGWQLLTPAASGNTWAAYGDPRDYVLTGPQGGSTVYARVYTCGLGNSGYAVYHDLISIAINVGFQDAGGGGGGGNGGNAP